jgi:tetratricopeptide (TPR) repeat protein
VKFRLTFLSALLCLAAACRAESTNRIQAIEHVSAPAPGTNDPVEIEFQKLMEDDDAALAEVDGWIRENLTFAQQGAGVPNQELNQRIRKRIEPVRLAYDDFIRRNPGHCRVRLSYASFLEDTGEPEAALEQMTKAKEIDPKNPSAWNNLANYYGHFSPVTNAFVHYEKAIELDPKEPVYFHNFGTTMFLFRRDAMEHYGIGEQQVFSKALALYSNSLALDPKDFVLATDIAMTYYGIKPPRNDDALKAWDYALKLAEGSLQREGVFIHLARIKMGAGNFSEARTHLNAVTNAELAELKNRVLRNLEAKEHPVPEPATNEPSVAATNTPALPATNALPVPAK